MCYGVQYQKALEGHAMPEKNAVILQQQTVPASGTARWDFAELVRCDILQLNYSGSGVIDVYGETVGGGEVLLDENVTGTIDYELYPVQGLNAVRCEETGGIDPLLVDGYARD